MGIFPGGSVDAQKQLGATHAAGLHEYAARVDNSLPESQIPFDVSKNLQNWDCPDAIDFPQFLSTINHIHQTGTIPSDHDSKESQNITQHVPLNDDRLLVDLKQKMSNVIDRSGEEWVFALVDGFMLYWNMDVVNMLDVKLFVKAEYHVLKRRREERARYVTIEGYWEDPPGYFDDIVYPNYVKFHEHLYTGERGLTFNDLIVLESEVQPVDDHIVTAIDEILNIIDKTNK
ncbi:6867_t:CDS:2 [Paraglomus occultum]|uniref:6867_t:CDS:1 n=1 Tax=Paraglomus occultum TaxID=144539 RepID=A0A9N9AUX1_9GLOM|nr:6867_t:CDS:2 [Paraglomus occultum]